MKLTHFAVAGAIALLATGAVPAQAQGLPGATVRADAKSGAVANDGRDAGKAAWRERCKDDPRPCDEMKAKMKERRAQCDADPEKCRAEFKARMAERCKANPQRCEEVKANREKRHAECKADPQKCRDEMKARREQLCKSDPQRCEQQKARFRERQEQCKADPEKCRPGNDRRPDGKQ